MRLIDADALMNTIIQKSYTVTDYWNTRDAGMFLVGIEQAINEQPTIEERKMSDLISRERAISELMHMVSDHGDDIYHGELLHWTGVKAMLEALPSAERMGHWIFSPSDAIELMFAKPKCSECGFESADGGNYCSNCGARMDGM